MKTFLKKFKASLALDRHEQCPGRATSEASRPDEECLRALDARLRSSRTGGEAPPDLHGAIMRAVRASAKENLPAPTPLLWPRLATAALIMMGFAGVFWALNRSPVNVPEAFSSTGGPPSLAAAMEQGHVLAQATPEAALRPLSGELELLRGDLQNAVNFVVASVP